CKRDFPMPKHKKSISSAEHRRFDVIIAGGGLAGLCMAAFLGQKNVRVCVIEREEAARLASPTFDGRSTAIAYGSTFILEDCRVWEKLRPTGCAIADIRVADQQSPSVLDFQSRAQAGEPFGYIVENSFFRATLFEQVKSLPSVTLKCPEAIAKIERD